MKSQKYLGVILVLWLIFEMRWLTGNAYDPRRGTVEDLFFIPVLIVAQCALVYFVGNLVEDFFLKIRDWRRAKHSITAIKARLKKATKKERALRT